MGPDELSNRAETAMADDEGEPKTLVAATERVVVRVSTRRAIVLSLVASVIFVLIIQPLLSVVSLPLTYMGGLVYTGLVDASFNMAVVGSSAVTNFYSFEILALAVIAAVAILTFRVFSTTKKEGLSEAQLKRSLIATRIVMPVYLLLSFLFVAIMLASHFVSIQANATYERRMMALAPVLTDQERRNLIGQWAMVDSRARYDELQKRLEDLAISYHITLPKPNI
jgi:hypothetical protein